MSEEVRKWLEGCSHILEFPWEDQQWEEEDEDEEEKGEASEDETKVEGEEGFVADPTLGKENAEDCEKVGAKNGEGSVTLR